jgi:SAM-dependent methyltransferase
MELDPDRRVGEESAKAYARRCLTGFWTTWIKGPTVVDIGYRGRLNAETIIDGAIGIEIGTPGYDGFNLPLRDGSVDTVHASHVLEHVDDDQASLLEWWRVVRPGGTLILMVPHADLYERKATVSPLSPSRWSHEHLRCYTADTLVYAIRTCFGRNCCRIRYLEEDDTDYDYSLPLTEHPRGCFEIVAVIEKITPPLWDVED